ncbi:hypothetical protein TTHERM_00022820 (macronuclear) [Tetrahymena thermophila SB210]|uniref:Kinase domain protein n=1 Tax=Tetrahymena thermophila (strain SB210) TaxID=312017 RepID=Q22RA0_TETTS|nr:hypothetical protein TTHERM_00022820 [Tetrahymena thermophila SB210]EAR88222.2 hypothetical protein TTHERM_00022820 [Tetrahymena thermophila SB210]|eukprot:XP_001008467.2 hypothetical protein TTHERM_00022820 [Tetrahymena thermophila SB210]
MITQKGIQVFSEALKTLVCLKKFNFYNQGKYSMIEGFSFILDSLSYMKDLIDLRIVFSFETIIFPVDAQIMVKSFKNLNQLKYLELKGFNLFQLQQNDEIADILANKILLETLIIFFHRIPEDNLIYNKISQNLQFLSNLKDLQLQVSDVSSRQIDLGFDFFSNSLIKLNNLECLNLQIQSGNQVDLLQFSALGDALKTLIKLKQLDLFLGDSNRNALEKLTKLQNLNIEIETKAISYKHQYVHSSELEKATNSTRCWQFF